MVTRLQHVTTRSFCDESEKRMKLWASYQIRKIAGCACAGNAGNVLPARRLQRKPLVCDPVMRDARAVMHVGIANPRWRGKRSRHTWRMRNPQVSVSGKRPMGTAMEGFVSTLRGLIKMGDIFNYIFRKEIWFKLYRQISNIRSTQFPNIDVSRLVLQLSLPNPLQPCVEKLRMKM